MDLGMTGLRVLVTAGAAGIGRSIVEAFAEEGARVFTCDVDATGLATLPEGVGHQVTDVADRAQVASLFDSAIAALGGLDVLVNNAGIAGPTGAVEEIHPEDWDRCIEVCLTSQFNCARLAVPHLRKSGNASIVNLSSAAGKFGFGFRSPYAAAKWGVIGFTRSLAIELGEAGIRVNAILPGLVAGDRQRRVLEARGADAHPASDPAGASPKQMCIGQPAPWPITRPRTDHPLPPSCGTTEAAELHLQLCLESRV